MDISLHFDELSVPTAAYLIFRTSKIVKAMKKKTCYRLVMR